MKKALCSLLAVAMLFSLSVPAFAASSDDQESLTPTLNTAIAFECIDNTDSQMTSRTSTSFSFNNLSSHSYKTSSEVYYIREGSGMLTINTLSWTPSGQELHVGFWNTETHSSYTVAYTGGSISNARINTRGVPSGDYKIYVYNAGTNSVVGNINYTMS